MDQILSVMAKPILFVILLFGSSNLIGQNSVTFSIDHSSGHKVHSHIQSNGDSIQLIFRFEEDVIECELEKNSDATKGFIFKVDSESDALQSIEMNNGALSEFYSSGLIKWNYACENDTCYETHYYKNGEISQRVIFLMPDSNSLYPAEEDYLLKEMRYQNGVTRFRDTVFSSKGNERKIYDSSGHLRLVVFNGPSNDWEGDFKEYYPNGQLRIQGSFEKRAGQFKVGEWLYYTSSGDLAMRQTYEKGQLMSEEVLIELSFEDAFVHYGY